MNAVEAVRGFDFSEINAKVNRKEVILPRIVPQNEEEEVSVDPVVLALREEPEMATGDDALLLARSIANRIARRGSEAINAQANIGSGSVRKILE